MNLSYKWLKEYIDFDLTPEELSIALTSLGLEVGGVEIVESIKGGLQGLVVGEVLSCEPHQDSDHLHVTNVNIGEEIPSQIVCGAPNVAKGQKVIVATLGTTLYSDNESFKIKKSKIRGVESFGMLCSASEIGVGKSHDGIIELPTDAPIGIKASEYYNIQNDYLLEVDITPNRIESASHFGVARDLAAYLKQNKKEFALKKPNVANFKTTPSTDNTIKVEIKNQEGCPRYSCLLIKDVKVADSPQWLQDRLTIIGLRPINNIVDITNFVLHELGHPLHAYDISHIKGDQFNIQNLQEGTKFVTLDGTERVLSDKDLMVCDANDGLCIAGVMGGKNSGVTDSTTAILLECAYFNPTLVRKTARRHGLNTDSSFRFERGVDANDTIYVLQRAASLILEIAGGRATGDIIDLYPQSIENDKVKLSIKKVNSLIGKEIEKDTILSILDSLEIKILEDKNNELLISIPTYRTDIKRDVDVIEDILRIYGYNNVEIGETLQSNLSFQTDNDRSFDLQNTIASLLTGAGFNEILNNSLTKEKYYTISETYKIEKNVKVVNALSLELNVMRQTLLFGGLESIEYNNNRKTNDIKFYEFGNCYFFDNQKNQEKNILAPYSEDFKLGIWISGSQYANAWNYTQVPQSFFDLRAYVESILIKLGFRNKYQFEQENSDDIFPSKLVIKLNNKEVGIITTTNQKTLSKCFDIKNNVYFAELSWNKLMTEAKKQVVNFKDIPKYPVVERDFALLVDKNVLFSEIEKISFKSDKKTLKKVQLFDVYEGKNLPEDKKSYAVKFHLQDEESTLTDKQIDAIMQKIYVALEKEIGAKLR